MHMRMVRPPHGTHAYYMASLARSTGAPYFML